MPAVGLIRELPESERPRERLLKQGSGALSDAELVAVLLRTGVKGVSVMQMATELLHETGGLSGLVALTPQTLRRKGLGPAKAASLLAALEIASRLAREQLREREPLTRPAEVARYLELRYRSRDQEVMGALFLDARNRLWASGRSSAARSTAPWPSRGRSSRRACCAAPPGWSSSTPTRAAIPTPSPEDLAFTRRMARGRRGGGRPAARPSHPRRRGPLGLLAAERRVVAFAAMASLPPRLLQRHRRRHVPRRLPGPRHAPRRPRRDRRPARAFPASPSRAARPCAAASSAPASACSWTAGRSKGPTPTRPRHHRRHDTDHRPSITTHDHHHDIITATAATSRRSGELIRASDLRRAGQGAGHPALPAAGRGGGQGARHAPRPGPLPRGRARSTRSSIWWAPRRRSSTWRRSGSPAGRSTSAAAGCRRRTASCRCRRRPPPSCCAASRSTAAPAAS